MLRSTRAFAVLLLRSPCAASSRPPLSAMSTRSRQQTTQPASNGATSTPGTANGNGAVAEAADAAAAPSPSSAPAGPSSTSAPPTAPLSVVVTDAVKRWYQDAEREAARGDVKQQALLAQMLTEGYGCHADLEAAKGWADKAKRRGYRMRGVYCSI